MKIILVAWETLIMSKTFRDGGMKMIFYIFITIQQGNFFKFKK